MTVTDFYASLSQAAPPDTLSLALQALWQDAKGDWHAAHRLIQDADHQDGHQDTSNSNTNAWVHAYLHRKEGDLDNASYWYRRAGKQRADEPLAAERQRIVSALLGDSD